MAVVYVDTDQYLDQVTYVAGDTITPRYGATLTVRQTNPNACSFIATDGTVFVDGRGVDTLTLNVVGTNGLSFTGNGKFIVKGTWKYIGTGNGTNSQNFTDWNSSSTTFLQVEKGNGTDTWHDLVMNANYTNVGPGEYLGRIFQKNSMTPTIVMGTTTSGIVPATGARLRTPNVLVTAATSVTMLGYEYMDLECCSFDPMVSITNTGRTSTPRNLRFVNFSYGSPLTPDLTYTLNMEMDGFFSTASILAYGINAPAGLNRLFIKSTTSSAYILQYTVATKGIHLNNCTLYTLGRTSNTTAGTLNLGYSLDAIVENCLFVGHRINLTSNVNLIFRNNKFSMTTNGANSSAGACYGVYASSNYNLTIDNFINVGSAPYLGVLYITNAMKYTIINTNFDCTSNAQYFIDGGQFNNQVEVINCTANNPRTKMFNWTTTTGPEFNTLLKNCFSNMPGTADIATTQNVRVLGVTSQEITSKTATDTEMYVFYDTGVTTGFLQLFGGYVPANAKGLMETISGNPRSDGLGSLIMANGDVAVLTPREKIYTLTSFTGANPTLVGTSTANVTCQYSISTDNKTTWSAWADATGANLAAETLNATNGFNIRIKFTATGAGLISYLKIPFNWNNSTSFPAAFVTLKLDNVVPGSSWRIAKTSDNSTIASGVAAGSSVTADVVYSGDTTVTIRVRKAGYLPFETGGTIISSGMNTWVSQVTDGIYQ